VLALLRQGHLTAAAQLAGSHELPISQARVHLAGGDASAALAALEPWRRQVEAQGWADERLKVLVLQAIALQAHGDTDASAQRLIDALAFAESGGFVRSFADEGVPMARLLSAAVARGRMTDYIGRLLAVFDEAKQKSEDTADRPSARAPIDPLSPRELEVLRLISQGLSNHEISERLVLALDTVKGHNRKIFGKLQVRRRTEAVVRARELGLF
jgi:LuxR family maltose regulon positive regulatory protein